MDFTALKKTFEGEGYTVSCFGTKADAADYLANRFDGEVIGIGGSITVRELGVYPRLCERNTVWWHWEKPDALAHESEFTAYICSANAVAETGEMVNIDGTGNRLAATLYGPKKVVFVCGRNKIVPDLNAAIERARASAAPNARRLGRKTPCALTGKCVNCKSPERICGAMTVYMRPMGGADETEIVFIDEDLGY